MKKEIKKKSQIGIWLDHAEAHFLHPAAPIETEETIESEYNSRERNAGEGADGIQLGGYRSTNNEHHKHQREQNALHQYYKDLQHKLIDYDEIFIFGPGQARSELYNLMKENQHFAGKQIQTATSDHLTEAQMKDKVNSHFAVIEQ